MCFFYQPRTTKKRAGAAACKGLVRRKPVRRIQCSINGKPPCAETRAPVMPLYQLMASRNSCEGACGTAPSGPTIRSFPCKVIKCILFSIIIFHCLIPSLLPAPTEPIIPSFEIECKNSSDDSRRRLEVSPRWQCHYRHFFTARRAGRRRAGNRNHGNRKRWLLTDGPPCDLTEPNKNPLLLPPATKIELPWATASASMMRQVCWQHGCRPATLAATLNSQKLLSALKPKCS